MSDLPGTSDDAAPSFWWFPLGGLALGAWSLWGTPDRATWAFEVLPLATVLAMFAATRRRFRFSSLAYALLLAFFAIQCVGGRYTFAEAPFPQTLVDLLGLERNPTDRLGHFMQGFVPAIVLREWLIRRRGLPRGGTLFWIVTACCLAFSAAYELLEMAVVLLFYPDAGPEWLGMQGDPWDAQWDMAMAAAGAVAAQLLLGRWHDAILALPPSRARRPDRDPS